MAKIYADLADDADNKTIVRKISLNIIDSLISLFVVTPLVVGFWRGMFDNFKIYNAMYGVFPVWPSLIVGLSAAFAFNYFRPSRSNTDNLKHYESKIKRIMAMKLYHYVFAFFSIMVWRCMFEASDILFGESGNLIKHFLHPSGPLKIAHERLRSETIEERFAHERPHESRKH